MLELRFHRIKNFLGDFFSADSLKRGPARLALKYKFFSIFHFPRSWNIRRILHLELTSRCNLMCKACYRVGELKDYMELNSMLSLENFKKLIEKYSPTQIISVIISGGENLLHPDFFAILKLIKGRFSMVPLVLSTNGIILAQKKDILDRLIHSEVTDLQVSLHGSTQETVSRLQTGIQLEKVLEVADQIQKRARINVSFNFVIQEENVEEMESFVSLVAKTSVKNITFTPMNFAGHSTKPVDYLRIWKKLDLKKRLEKVYQKANLLGISVPHFSPECYSLFSVDVFTAEGRMLPCWGNYLGKKYSIGNAFKSNPNLLRNQKQMRDLQKALLSGNPPELCVACWANGKYRSFLTEP